MYRVAVAAWLRIAGTIALFLVGARPSHGQPPVGPRIDRYGDALPEGAIARLGTLRLTDLGGIEAVAISPDGTVAASGVRDGKETYLGERNVHQSKGFLPPAAKRMNDTGASGVENWRRSSPVFTFQRRIVASVTRTPSPTQDRLQRFQVAVNGPPPPACQSGKPAPVVVPQFHCLSAHSFLHEVSDFRIGMESNGCYRWLAHQLKGFEQAKAARPRTLV